MNSLLLDVKDAWLGLLRKPLRSLLSSLGIGIGVTALITMLSISEGAKKSALEKIHSLGTHTLRIETIVSAATGGSSVNLSQGIHHEDAVLLSEWLGSRGRVGEYIRSDNVVLHFGNKSVVGTILGVNAQWFAAENVNIAQGRALTREDVLRQSNYGVIGHALADALQVGLLSTVQFAQYPTTIIGLAAPKGRLLTEGTGLSSLDFDNTLILPIATMPFTRVIAGRALRDGLVISLDSKEERIILSTAEQVERMLLKNHREVRDFMVVIPLSLIKEARESQQVFSLIMGTIAGLSLLVGGIGVMNVMLANVAEQTREIGLRMAVGASKARIMSLYLWNAVLLTLSGGLWGTGVGAVLALVIQYYAGWEVVFSTFSLFLAPCAAVLVGVVFGLQPALRAASLDPAQALRDT